MCLAYERSLALTRYHSRVLLRLCSHLGTYWHVPSLSHGEQQLNPGRTSSATCVWLLTRNESGPYTRQHSRSPQRTRQDEEVTLRPHTSPHLLREADGEEVVHPIMHLHLLHPGEEDQRKWRKSEDRIARSSRRSRRSLDVKKACGSH